MATEVKLPALGEGVTDATISRWRVKEGDEVKTGDVILEVATDKVDTEVAAPASGKILRLNAREGEIASVDAVLALIGAPEEQTGTTAPTIDAPTSPKTEPAALSAPVLPAMPSANGAEEVKATPVAKRVASEKGIPLAAVIGTGAGGQITKDDVLAYSKPAPPAPSVAEMLPELLPDDLADQPTLSVQRLAAEHNINLAEIASGRPLRSLTRYDLLSAVASRAAGKPVTVEPRFLPPQGAPVTPAPAAPPPEPSVSRPQATPSPAPTPVAPHAGEELVKHSRMRQAIARNTTQSAFTAPHVTTWWEVDMSAVLTHRKAHKAEFAAAGVNLTVTAYLIQAIIAGLKAVPAANASWSDEGVMIKRYYNVGMAVALSSDQYGLGGLIVPVIKQAGDLNLMGLARAVNDLAEKARAGKLTNDELQGGTFTLSNYGTSGSRFQTPVIVQPQVGILGAGAIEKRAIVVSNGSPLEANLGDSLAFKPMMTIALSYDHRVLDGATADAFCAVVKKTLEGIG